MFQMSASIEPKRTQKKQQNNVNESREYSVPPTLTIQLNQVSFVQTIPTSNIKNDDESGM
jgi:hypothetical protein